MDKKYLLLIFIIVILIYFNLKKETFIPSVELTEYSKIRTLSTFMKRVCNILEENNIEYWIYFGTLLGSVRDKGIIPWEDNLNICIMESEMDKLLKLSRKFRDEYKLHITKIFFGYQICNIDNKYPFIDLYVMINHKDYIFFKSEDIYKLWKNHVTHKSNIFPLKLVEFYDYYVYAPNNPIAILDSGYPNWRKEGIKRSFNHVTSKSDLDINKFNIEYDINRLTIWQYVKYNVKNNIKKACNYNCQILFVNEKNILNYLPEISEYKSNDNLVKYYPILLLYKYGGIYINEKIQIKENIEPIRQLLKGHDFVYVKHQNEIITSVLGSKPNSYMLAELINNISENDNNLDYEKLYVNTINEFNTKHNITDNYVNFNIFFK